MRLLESVVTSLTYVVNLFSPTSIEPPRVEEQTPLQLESPHAHARPTKGRFTHLENLRTSHDPDDLFEIDIPVVESPKGPVFKPPSAPVKGPGSDFVCDYSIW